jgi:hypothetical protein
MLIGRRRPLLRAATMVGAGAVAYNAGKRTQAGREHEYQQDMAIQQMGQSPQPTTSAPGSSGISEDAISRLKELGKLHEQGVLNDAEFEAQKKQILAG